MNIKGYALASISAISYGLIPLFVLPLKAIQYPLDTTLFYRFFISALVILAYLLYKKESLKLNGVELLIMAVLGIFYALSSETLFLAYDYLTPGIASTILFVYPVIVVLIMVFFFKERITKLTIVSLFITMCGVLALSVKESIIDINFAGLFIALLSALFYALYMIIVSKGKLSFSGFKVIFYSMLFSSVYYLVKSLLLKESLAIPDTAIFTSLVLFALVTTVLSISTLVFAIKLIGSTPTSIMGALEPVVAVAVSVLLFHEEFTFSLFIGVTLIIAGVIVNIIAESRNKNVMV